MPSRRNVHTFASMGLRSICLLMMIIPAIPTRLPRTPTTLAATSNTYAFPIRQLFGTGTERTESIAIGDMDADGALDIVMGNASHSSMTTQDMVYLNDGSGAFPRDAQHTRKFGPGGDNTISVAVADMDADGDLDIVAGNTDGGGVLVYLNDGHSNFSEGKLISGGGHKTNAVAIGDMDGDSDFDVVIGNYGDGQRNYVYFNKGDGTFPLTTLYQLPDTGNINDPAYTRSIALADLDRDGDLDIVAGNDDKQQDRLPRHIAYYRNIGAQRFGKPQFLGSEPVNVQNIQVQGVAIGDVNRDNMLDIVVAQAGAGGQNQFYLNTTSTSGISFQAPLKWGIVNERTESVALGDVDGDGDLDIAAGKIAAPDVVYLNNGASDNIAFNSTLLLLGPLSDQTTSIALADMNNDGDLDVATSNYGQPSAVHLSDGRGNYRTSLPFGSGAEFMRGLAIGDIDGVNGLDVVVARANNGAGPKNAVLLNNGQGRLAVLREFGTNQENSTSVALGDINGDHDLDVVVGNNDGTYNQVYENSGGTNFNLDVVRNISGTSGKKTTSVALGDLDGDSDLDLVFGYHNYPSAIYRNDDGKGNFVAHGSLGTGVHGTQSIALGDLDRDGDLDIVTGNIGKTYDGAPNVIYLNDGRGQFPTSQQFGTGFDRTKAVAVGDLDADGYLDIAVGNEDHQNAVYLNNGNAQFSEERLFGTGADTTTDVTIVDADGDSDLDLITGNYDEPNAVYLNDGLAQFTRDRVFGSSTNQTLAVAAGDMDSDGDIDLITGNSGQGGYIYLGASPTQAPLGDALPRVTIKHPVATGRADGFATPIIHTERYITFNYTLMDSNVDEVGQVQAWYSLDGGGHWTKAEKTASTDTTDLTTSRSGVTHVYGWDTFTSGVFGYSAHVVFRIEVYPSMKPRAHRTAGPYQRRFVAAQTFPFRVRGTQVRVLDSAKGLPVEGALVYRLPQGQPRGATLIANSAGEPYQTNKQGYLQGRGRVEPLDRLLAVRPITPTVTTSPTATTHIAFHTSGISATTGLPAYQVRTPGVQALKVYAAHPLITFPLTVSLEWDARSDTQFLAQLELDLKRTSEALYDWTNGQVALGKITVYHDRQHWLDAHVRIYASNQIRPSAAQGGIVNSALVDPNVPSITYEPGQIRIGAVWNRFGDPHGSLSVDWPRTLAHELGHYALFLDDDYLGVRDNQLISVESCGDTAMSDPYRNDTYSEFRYDDALWQVDCAETLAHVTTKRADWQTIEAFYPLLDSTRRNPGPHSQAVEFTEVVVAPYTRTNTTLNVPIFYLHEAGKRYQARPGTRAFLFQDKRITNLGQPTFDQLLARGARPNDDLCVYDQAAQRMSCEKIQPGDEHIEMQPMPVSNWQPKVTVTPVTSTTLQVEVGGVTKGLTLSAQLWLVNANATIVRTMVAQGATYVTTFPFSERSLEGYVELKVIEPTPQRRAIVEYSIGGNPRAARYFEGFVRSKWGFTRAKWVPGASIDGGVTLFGLNLQFAPYEYFTLQATTTATLPLGLSVVGHPYRLAAKDSVVPKLQTGATSINFNYLGSQVPLGEERTLRIYFWDGAKWDALATKVDTHHNFATAPTRGVGVYALMAGFELQLTGPGWNTFAYPLPEPRTVTDTLRSIQGHYTAVYGYDAKDTADPWKIFTVGGPSYVDQLHHLDLAQTYWISVTDDVKLRVSSGNESMMAASAGQAPPATFYGEVKPTPGFTPVADMLVRAFVDGIECGRSRTRRFGAAIVYVIDVRAIDPGVNSDCGVRGRSVTFQVDAYTILGAHPWDNNRVWNVNFNEQLPP